MKEKLKDILLWVLLIGIMLGSLLLPARLLEGLFYGRLSLISIAVLLGLSIVCITITKQVLKMIKQGFIKAINK